MEYHQLGEILTNEIPKDQFYDLFFLIYVNDMPNVYKSVNIILFADDTNIETIGCTNKEIESDLEAINNWLER